MTQEHQVVDKLMGYYKSCTLKIRGGVERDANGKKAGKKDGWMDNQYHWLS
jgi:hypothetical protein